MTSSAFARMATITASTKRPPAIVAGKRGTAATYLTGLRCTPLDPIDPELRARLGLPQLAELLQTCLQGSPDVREGDTLVVGTHDYPIRAVADWSWPADASVYRLLVLEQPSTGKSP